MIFSSITFPSLCIAERARLIAVIIFLLSGISLQASIIIGNGIERFPLGTAFDPVSKKMLNTCVIGEVKSIGAEKAWLESYISSDLATMIKNVDQYASGGINLGIYGESCSVTFFSHVSAKDLRESFVFEFHVQTASIILKPNPMLNLYGREVALVQDPLLRRSRCGSEFVQQIDLGYRLWVAITINFKTSRAHEYYKVRKTRSALFGAIKKTTESIKELKEFKDSISIDIDALQEGGDGRYLQDILRNRRICNGENIELCIELFDKILVYARSDEYGLRAPAFDATYDPSNHLGPVVLRYLTVQYDDAGIEGMNSSQ